MNHQHAVVPFQFETHEIRTIKDEKNEPWFVAKDICDVLGLENVTNAIRSIPEKHKGVNLIKTLGGKQTVNIISEPGLYRLVLRSDKPQAEPFMDWVTEEVLPSIRKRGFYGNLNKEGVKTLVADVAAEVVAVLQARQQKGPFVDTTGVKGFLAWLDHDLKGDSFTRKGDLYAMYSVYCVDHGIRADSPAHFFTRLYRAEPSLKGARIQVDGKRTPVVVGISVNGEASC